MKIPDVSPIAKIVTLVVALSTMGAIAVNHLREYDVTRLQAKALTCIQLCEANCKKNGVPLDRCDCDICFEREDL